MKGSFAFLSWLIALVVVGCTAEQSSTGETCVQGQTRGCPCDDGGPGTQSCLLESPASWSSCTCNMAPVADAGGDFSVLYRTTVQLDGTASYDPDSSFLEYHWELVAVPAGSTTALDDETAARPTFLADLHGTYVARLIVGDGERWSMPALVTITSRSETAPVALHYRPIDAEYSRALDRIIMIAAAPNTLQIYDPTTGASTAVGLPATPTSVSVSPNGLQAAVGHNGSVSIVDLQSANVTVTHPVTTNSGDVVLADNGYVYVFPALDQWERIRSVQIATGLETLHTGSSIYARTKAKLHPDGTAIYGTRSDIEKYSISGGPATYAYDSPYHADPLICGDLWMSEDGLRIITNCGGVFRASETMSHDMTYNGSLSGLPRIQYAVHAPAAGKLLAIPGTVSHAGTGLEDTVVRIYSYGFMNFEEQVDLPPFAVLGNEFPSHGRFVFSHSTGTEYYVVIQADATSALLEDHAVVAFSF